jgi:hypothetical protein
MSAEGKKEQMISCFNEFDDGFLKCDIVFEDNSISQVSIVEAKYIQFWGQDLGGFINVMRKFKLNENSTLSFIDEFSAIKEKTIIYEKFIFLFLMLSAR